MHGCTPQQHTVKCVRQAVHTCSIFMPRPPLPPLWYSVLLVEDGALNSPPPRLLPPPCDSVSVGSALRSF